MADMKVPRNTEIAVNKSDGSISSHRMEEMSVERKSDFELSSGEVNNNEIPESDYISGWKLHVLTLALSIALFAAQMEATIVSTSVIAITNELKGFTKSSWIFTGFLLTYSCLVIIWAKLSDIYGRKPLLLSAIFIFTVFSGACGASHTLVQLIIFRCFQGMGASALVTMSITLSVTFGPLIGGAINNNTTWRWIFLLNAPLGAVSFLTLLLLEPKVFPNQRHTSQTPINAWGHFTLKSLQRVDILGATVLLAACIFLITALQQAADGASFGSKTVVPLLALSAVMWSIFLVWSWFLTSKREFPEPVFPWRFVTSRVAMGMILNTFFTGTIITVCTIQIPQRFQTVNGDSAFIAGTRLIPFSIMVPMGAVIGVIIIGRSRIPPIYFLFAGGVLEIAGTIGLSRTPNTYKIWPAQYVFQVLAGTGVGFFNGTLTLLVPFAVEKRDLGVGTAAVAQFKVLGGMALLAIVTCVMNSWVRAQLEASTLVSLEEVKLLLQTTDVIAKLPAAAQIQVREIFGRGYNLQMKIMIGCAAAQLPSTLLMWTKKPIMVQK